MSANYLHGIEVIRGTQGVVPIRVVKTAVIGLVGIAPEGDANTPILVQSRADAAQFGSDLPGFDIPKSIALLLAMGAGPIIVVNTFSSSSNTTTVTNESHTITNGKCKLTYIPVGAVTVNDSAGVASTLIAGTDYSIDAYGTFTALSSTAANGTVLKFTYKKLNGGSVNSSQIIGTYDGTTQAYTGIQCWDQAKTLFGFTPKILIAPNYSSVSAVAAELKAKALKYRAFTYLDAPYGTTVAGAIAGRGLAGTINFNTSDKRTELCFPYLKAYDPATDSAQDFPMAVFAAGLRSKVDLEEGYHVSASNHEIPGVLGLSIPVTGSYTDSDTQANSLNEIGISTVINEGGLMYWGNHNASYPGNNAPDCFSTDVRTADIIHESLMAGLAPFIDKPIIRAVLDVLQESGNSFIRTLVGRGALIPGSRIEFPVDLNTPTELAQGKVHYKFIRMVPPPMERITIEDVIDISLLKNLIS